MVVIIGIRLIRHSMNVLHTPIHSYLPRPQILWNDGTSTHEYLGLETKCALHDTLNRAHIRSMAGMIWLRNIFLFHSMLKI